MVYEPVIGLEVHAQLLTDSKIFCGCSTLFGAEPNTQTCPVCLGLPGVLPVVNRKVVEYGVKMALAVHCEVNERSLFVRKNYFYPDLPKGYQISQYEAPLAKKGWIEIELGDDNSRKIGIERIHIEEDAGKLVHAEAYVGERESLIDFNRCGVPLIEIVSEPDIRSPGEARLYLAKLRQILCWLDICDGNMEEGSLRCDANVSLRRGGEPKLGIKTELKNMNSFRSLERALTYEIGRQARVLDAGGTVVQETLLWDESEGVAIPMRGKEEVHDYRYFPDPDLLPLVIEREWMEEMRRTLPEMADERKRRWVREYGLPEYDASVLSEDRGIADYFEAVVEKVEDPRQVSNWVMGEFLRILKEKKLKIDQLEVRPLQLAEIIQMVEKGKISHTAGKTVFEEVAHSGMDPQKVVEKMRLFQVSDPKEIEKVVERVIENHPEEVQKFLGGREGVFEFLMGGVMKATKGKANPKMASEVLRKKLDEMRG